MSKQTTDQDAERIVAIREIFGDDFDGCRDHCIVHGFSVDEARHAYGQLATTPGWRSPLGSFFGGQPKSKKQLGVGQTDSTAAVSPVPESSPDAI